MIPDFVKVQTRAILNAQIAVKRAGGNPIAKIMIPLVGHVNELAETRRPARGRGAGGRSGDRRDVEVDYKFGTMIEVPRGALTADEIASEADFFSFGTNDLTQMTFGYSRDDAEGGFLLKYVEDKILPVNPFQTLDRRGRRASCAIAVEKGRATRPDIELGICGEHGGDPDSIAFCHQIGLDYVSCSPFRVPVARLAAAQAALTRPPSATAELLNAATAEAPAHGSRWGLIRFRFGVVAVVGALGMAIAIGMASGWWWWQQSASALGTDETGGAYFNMTMVLIGITFIPVSVTMNDMLRDATATGLAEPRWAMASRVGLWVLPFAFAAVGIWRIDEGNRANSIHNIAGFTIPLVVMAMMLTAGFGLPGLFRRFEARSLVIVGAIVALFVISELGIVSYALMEMLSFVICWWWLLALATRLDRRLALEDLPAAEPA